MSSRVGVEKSIVPALLFTDAKATYTKDAKGPSAVKANGYVAMEAAHYTRKVGDWRLLPGIGKTGDGLTIAYHGLNLGRLSLCATADDLPVYDAAFEAYFGGRAPRRTTGMPVAYQRPTSS